MRSIHAILASALIATAMFACKDRERAVSTEENTTNGNTAQQPPASEGPNSTTPMPGTDQISDSLVFSIERTACFGTCPYYQLHVYRSGFATFNGMAHVDKMGLHHGQVSEETRAQLIREAEQHDLFGMEDEYDSPVTDLPATTIMVRRNGDTKRVMGRVGAPPAFRELANRVEELLFPIAWKPVATPDQPSQE